MRDPEMVSRAQRAAASAGARVGALARHAWPVGRTHAAGVQLRRLLDRGAMGRPRVVFGVDAREAELLADLLGGAERAGPYEADPRARPVGQRAPARSRTGQAGTSRWAAARAGHDGEPGAARQALHGRAPASVPPASVSRSRRAAAGSPRRARPRRPSSPTPGRGSRRPRKRPKRRPRRRRWRHGRPCRHSASVSEASRTCRAWHDPGPQQRDQAWRSGGGRAACRQRANGTAPGSGQGGSRDRQPGGVQQPSARPDAARHPAPGPRQDADRTARRRRRSRRPPGTAQPRETPPSTRPRTDLDAGCRLSSRGSRRDSGASAGTGQAPGDPPAAVAAPGRSARRRGPCARPAPAGGYPGTGGPRCEGRPRRGAGALPRGRPRPSSSSPPGTIGQGGPCRRRMVVAAMVWRTGPGTVASPGQATWTSPASPGTAPPLRP